MSDGRASNEKILEIPTPQFAFFSKSSTYFSVFWPFGNHKKIIFVSSTMAIRSPFGTSFKIGLL